jgi:hypothetical protein
MQLCLAVEMSRGVNWLASGKCAGGDEWYGYCWARVVKRDERLGYGVVGLMDRQGH